MCPVGPDQFDLDRARTQRILLCSADALREAHIAAYDCLATESRSASVPDGIVTPSGNESGPPRPRAGICGSLQQSASNLVTKIAAAVPSDVVTPPGDESGYLPRVVGCQPDVAVQLAVPAPSVSTPEKPVGVGSGSTQDVPIGHPAEFITEEELFLLQQMEGIG